MANIYQRVGGAHGSRGLIHGHFMMERSSASTLDLQATSPNTDACSVEQVRVRDSQERL